MVAAQKQKIIGLSCGRKDGNNEILLKEALMAAEEMGVESEIIRAMDLRVKPCRGCEACTMSMGQGKEPECAIKDDDVPWILDRVCVEDCALIVSLPTYHLRANGYFEIINERMLPVLMKHPEIIKKTRVGAIISAAGGRPEWTPLALISANIFMQHTRKLVDQVQINCPTSRPGSVLTSTASMERARLLGQRIARALSMPIEEVTYMGEEKDVSCPVCHCDVVKVPDKLPYVYCPVCWVKGELYMDGGVMKVKWDEENVKNPRFSVHELDEHFEYIKNSQIKFFMQDAEKVKNMMPKYISYGKTIKP